MNRHYFSNHPWFFQLYSLPCLWKSLTTVSTRLIIRFSFPGPKLPNFSSMSPELKDTNSISLGQPPVFTQVSFLCMSAFSLTFHSVSETRGCGSCKVHSFILSSYGSFKMPAEVTGAPSNKWLLGTT
jgi:hypothetical protein